jgi:sterol desaturase/sphingolipid hydroxylase (fatty acid hydroxylase superfamily)
MPLWLRLSAALIVNEVGGYWGHRWSHEIPFLWRFHGIHHSAEEVDFLVTSKAHPVDMFFTRLCATVPLYVLGLAQPLGTRVDLVPVYVTALTMYWAYFLHANIKWRFGWLEWLISTPGFHHWHHTNDGPDVIDKNYAAMLPLVDKCFGTLYLPREWPAKYGSDTAIASDLTGQLLDPISMRESKSLDTLNCHQTP